MKDLRVRETKNGNDDNDFVLFLVGDGRTEVEALLGSSCRRGRRRLVSARNGHSSVRLLAGSGGDVLVLPLLESGGSERWADGVGPGWCVEAVLFHLGSRALDLDGRCLQGEWLRLVELACVLRLATGFTVLGGRVGIDIGWMAWWRAPAAGAGREGTEARSVGSGLRAQLSKVEVGTGAVADSHGLAELALRPESVEDDGVDDDAEGLDDDFDNAAYERPVLWYLLVSMFEGMRSVPKCLPGGGRQERKTHRLRKGVVACCLHRTIPTCLCRFLAPCFG